MMPLTMLKTNVSGTSAEDHNVDKIPAMLEEPMNTITHFTKSLSKNSLNRSEQWKPNVTVSAIIERDGKFMMIEEFSHGRLVYNQPAGHLEDDESLFQAVEREVREETAWGFKPEMAVGLYMHPSPSSDITYLRICFTGSCHDYQQDLPLDDGIHKVLWMSIEEIRQNVDRLRSPIVLHCLNDYLAGNRFPLDYFKHSSNQE